MKNESSDPIDELDFPFDANRTGGLLAVPNLLNVGELGNDPDRGALSNGMADRVPSSSDPLGLLVALNGDRLDFGGDPTWGDAVLETRDMLPLGGDPTWGDAVLETGDRLPFGGDPT